MWKSLKAPSLLALVFLCFLDVGVLARDLYLPAIVSNSGSSEVSPEGRLPSGISKGLVTRVAVNNTIIVTWANSHYTDFALNFIAHMRRLNLTNFIIGAMDRELLSRMNKEGVNTWFMGSKGMDQNTVKHDFGWGSPKFHKMGRDKIRLIRDFAELGVDALISDIDVAWLQDPLPYFNKFPQADMLVSTDQLRNESKGESLEFHICQTASNIGIMWIRSTPGSVDMTRKWVEVIENKPQEWDQNTFNNLKAEGGSCQGKRDKDGLMMAYNGKVRMGVLPVALFSNGHTFYVQRLQDRLPGDLKPYAVHATFQYGGTPGKRHRMREALVWEGESHKYFQHEGGFLSYTPHIPSDLDMGQFSRLGFPSARDGEHPNLTPNSPALQHHVHLVNFQLAQMRQALAMAWVLGRVLVAPRFLCGLDRVWFPHYGRFPGSILKLPFECPLDHVINIEHIFRRSKGGVLPFKEHSFLDNPHLPNPPNSTNLVFVRPVVPAPNTKLAFDIPSWTTKTEGKLVEYPMTKDYVVRELGALKDVKYLHLTNIVKAFDGVGDLSRSSSFMRETHADSTFADAWCCTTKGNMRYNFLA